MEKAYPKQVNYLRSVVISGTINHAYCFIGTDQGGQNHLLEYLCQEAACTDNDGASCGQCDSCTEAHRDLHADILTIQGEINEPIGIELAHAVHRHLASRPVLAPKRIALIKNAHHMTAQAANALLKIVEEPPKCAVILMSTSLPDMLPATLLSRMQAVRVPRMPHTAVKQLFSEVSAYSQQQQETYTHLADGRFERVLQLSDPEGEEKEWWHDQLQLWITFLLSSTAKRDALIQKEFMTGKQSKEKVHTLPQVLGLLEIILRDTILHNSGFEGMKMIQLQGKSLEQLQKKYSVDNSRHALSQLTDLKRMCAHNVNKKMIFDYLITRI
ncbi:MAG: hypothetical protein ABIG66_04520 [Candidatus Kerfeldbacteria bacterium]